MICNYKASQKYYINALKPVVDNSLILWLTSDDGIVSLWEDRSGYNNNANASSGASRYLVHLSNIFGYGYILNGINGYLGIPYSTYFNTTAITLEAWVKSTTFTGNRAILWRDSTTTGTRFFQLYINASGNIVFNYRNTLNSYSIVTSNQIIPLNTLTHIVCTCGNNNNMSIYINGIKDINTMPFIGTMNTGIESIYIGSNKNGSQYQWNGIISEVRMYNRILLDTEILYNYTHSPSYYIQKTL